MNIHEMINQVVASETDRARRTLAGEDLSKVAAVAEEEGSSITDDEVEKLAAAVELIVEDITEEGLPKEAALPPALAAAAAEGPPKEKCPCGGKGCPKCQKSKEAKGGRVGAALGEYLGHLTGRTAAAAKGKTDAAIARAQAQAKRTATAEGSAVNMADKKSLTDFQQRVLRERKALAGANRSKATYEGAENAAVRSRKKARGLTAAGAAGMATSVGALSGGKKKKASPVEDLLDRFRTKEAKGKTGLGCGTIGTSKAIDGKQSTETGGSTKTKQQDRGYESTDAGAKNLIKTDQGDHASTLGSTQAMGKFASGREQLKAQVLGRLGLFEKEAGMETRGMSLSSKELPGPDGVSKSGEGKGDPSGKGANMVGSNERATSYTKKDAKSLVKKDLGKVLAEPALSRKSDPVLHNNLRSASKAGVKIAGVEKTEKDKLLAAFGKGQEDA